MASCHLNVPSSEQLLNAFRGFGFVTFEDPAIVPQVLAIRQHVVDGKTVSVFPLLVSARSFLFLAKVDPKAAVMKVHVCYM